ncbi:3-oxoacyl-[acyl-carrier protein] reductase [Amycolatopsis arida]|uniref:3-oxoacyl-[acyl-carrier protein] reductase n=1 Tax=Amycolatopsis arida TaxID=587909 RepID=A0A1I5YDW9_9PSEU|nr:3-oxoacyl-[acyl-carrier protein] reductase [Amycolatopsis arida]SFQ42406.1 3-oxoacyl-[acyl-carrier protein] reductase [Amycolatopsis arida]
MVTGGARGIGRAVVRRLVAEGATVVFSYARDDAAAAEVAGERAHAVRADQAEPAEVERLFAVADEVLGGVDVLVGNAGVAASTPLAEVTLAEYERVMAVNARGTFLAVQQAARRLGEGGRIVVVSSVTTVWPSPGESVYAASKAAVEQIARVASRELGPRGVTVNTVSPGVTDTDLLRAAAPPEAVAGVAGMTPLRRLGTPADVADVVAFLCGPDARWVTGQNLRADGGLV